MGLFELIYYLGYRAKTYADLKRQRRLPKKVICVGNLTTGGTGKTPAAIALAGEAGKRGFAPCVLTRGYRGRLKGPVLVTAGMDANDTGDEPLLMAEKLKGIPVIKGGDRYASGMYALESVRPEPDLFILDDGYQHRRLFRDLDILLIDSGNPFDNGRLLPVGMLREPVSQMKRANVIVLTKDTGGDIAEIEGFIKENNSSAPVFRASHSAVSLRRQDGKEIPLRELKGKKVFAFSAIAGPEQFLDSIRRAGAEIAGMRAYRDHYQFKEEDVKDIKEAAKDSGAEWILTTEKDIMRLRGTSEGSKLKDIVSLGIEFRADGGFFDAVFGGLNA